ncbi:response regulator [Bacteriovoracaceae bacterium]|nr:response regulator [Bacteriovoracaceae bacterium]
MPNTNDVLLIDDDRDILDTLEMYCENLGYFRNIIKAKDGSEASIKLHNQAFAVILMDVNMPRKSGVDLLKEFTKESENSIDSVIVVSGELNKRVIEEAVANGAKNFIVKPFDEDAFVQKVTSVLKKVRPDLLEEI